MSMNTDLLILIVGWVLTSIMLILFIPRGKIREAQLIFLFKLSITRSYYIWFFGLKDTKQELSSVSSGVEKE